jgi:hypothetical protein
VGIQGGTAWSLEPRAVLRNLTWIWQRVIANLLEVSMPSFRFVVTVCFAHLDTFESVDSRGIRTKLDPEAKASVVSKFAC